MPNASKLYNDSEPILLHSSILWRSAESALHSPPHSIFHQIFQEALDIEVLKLSKIRTLLRLGLCQTAFLKWICLYLFFIRLIAPADL